MKRVVTDTVTLTFFFFLLCFNANNEEELAKGVIIQSRAVLRQGETVQERERIAEVLKSTGVPENRCSTPSLRGNHPDPFRSI